VGEAGAREQVDVVGESGVEGGEGRGVGWGAEGSEEGEVEGGKSWDEGCEDVGCCQG
jgi:hypothetical protein